jgi:hypothetical protein
MRKTAEGRYAFEPANSLSPEKLFDLHWALNVSLKRSSALRLSTSD